MAFFLFFSPVLCFGSNCFQQNPRLGNLPGGNEKKKSADYEQSNVGRAFPELSVLICTLGVVIGFNSWISFSQAVTV